MGRGLASLNDYLQEEFGFGIDSLTQGEAGHLRAAPSLDAIRDRIAEARRQASISRNAGTAPEVDSDSPLFSRDQGFTPPEETNMGQKFCDHDLSKEIGPAKGVL